MEVMESLSQASSSDASREDCWYSVSFCNLFIVGGRRRREGICVTPRDEQEIYLVKFSAHVIIFRRDGCASHAAR
jgi:hypothetical protein